MAHNKGGVSMVYAYILENIMKVCEVDNKPIFKFIKECELPETSIYIDKMGDVTRPELKKLQNIVADGDTVLVRSLLDLADKPDDLISLLNCFGVKNIEVVSIVEPYYKYGDSFLYIKNAFTLYADFSEKKRRLGIERAKAEGRMGRKSDKDIVDKVKRLKKAGFSIQEIVSLCGISRSTYYRMIKM